MDDLLENFQTMTDLEILFNMQAALSHLREGHSWSALSSAAQLSTNLPLTFRHFGGNNGGVHLVATTNQFSNALNLRLVSINGIDMDTIFERITNIQPIENVYFLRTYGIRALSSSEYLSFMGLRENGVTVFTLTDDNGNTVDITLTAQHETQLDFTNIALTSDEVNIVRSRNAGEVPRVFQGGENRFYFLEEYGLLYIVLAEFISNAGNQLEELSNREFEARGININDLTIEQMVDPENTAVQEVVAILREWARAADFTGLVVPPYQNEEISPIFWGGDGNPEQGILGGRQLWTTHPALLQVIAENDVQAIVVDARNNGGGDPAAFIDMFKTLSQSVDEGRLFYFINGYSYSATSIATRIISQMGAVIVGEPLGQNAIFYGIASDGADSPYFPYVTLTNSNLTIRIPNVVAHIESETFGFEVYGLTGQASDYIENSPNFEFYTIRPDVQVIHTIEHWANNEDPVLNHVINSLNLSTTSQTAVSAQAQQNAQLVPFRTVAENANFGGNIQWNAETSQITVTTDTAQFLITIGSTTVVVNHASQNGITQNITVDTAPIIRDGRTYVTEDFFQTVFGINVLDLQ
ncbi:MAG: stalk domain-containing protein [Defluviitaleaceae bacterium]|nr:stalk domain-containing protein [Defluviitaleaceae bacterium]